MSEWISVKDRLPPHDVDVLTYIASARTPIQVGSCSQWVEDEPPTWGVGAESLGCDPVTHWMPLPEPPHA